jgi:hypothetical protein
VIDTLATFLPLRTENNAALILEALQPLQRLTTLGVGVLVNHHPRKGESLPGRAARGSRVMVTMKRRTLCEQFVLADHQQRCVSSITGK